MSYHPSPQSYRPYLVTFSAKFSQNFEVRYLHSDEHVRDERRDRYEDHPEPEHERGEQHPVHAAHHRAD